MPAKQFEILLQTLKELREEAEATSRALRILEGQSGPMGASGNTRTAYIRGVEQSNASSSLNQSVGNLMPLAAAAAIVGRGGSGQPWSDILTGSYKEPLGYLGSIPMYGGKNYSLQDWDIARQTASREMKFWEGRVENGKLVRPPTAGELRIHARGQELPLSVRRTIDAGGGFSPLHEPPSSKLFGDTGPAGLSSIAADNKWKALLYNKTPPIRRIGFNVPPPNRILPASFGSKAMMGPGGPQGTFRQSIRGTAGYGILGALGVIGNEILNTKNSINKEYYSAGGWGRPGQYGIGGGMGYNTFGGGVANFAEGIGLAAERAAPSLTSFGFMAYGAGRAVSALNVARTAGVRGGIAAMGGAGGMFTSGSSLAMAGTAGVAALFYTAIQALPDAIGTVKQAAGWGIDTVFGTAVGRTTPEVFENRQTVRQLAKLRMFRRVQDNMPGRQGMTGGVDPNTSVSGGYVERAIQQKADQLANRSGGFMDISIAFGGHDNILRNYLSYVGLAKSRKELRDEAVKQLVWKDKHIEEFRTKGWEAMHLGDFHKARYFFNEAFNQAPKEGAPEAWRDPMQIYTEVHASRISSRHYAASFITRPTLRTGD